MPLFNLDWRDFQSESEFVRAAFQRTPDEVWAQVRIAAFDAEREVKQEMPWDTGRAANSWGHSTSPFGPDDGIWQENKDGLQIVEGTNVEYVQYLNEGHSSQAPAGFIDAIGVRTQDDLEENMLDLLVRLWT
jgi:hypothetical protein